MPTRKTATKASSKIKPPPVPIHPLYAVPIYEVIARGDLQEMRKLAAQAKKYVADIQTAIAKLDRKLK